MSSYLSQEHGYDKGSVPRNIWGERNLNPYISTFGGTELVPAIKGGKLVGIPRKEACVVFKKPKGHHADYRSDKVLGFFDLKEAWQLTSCGCDSGRCTCKSQENLPFHGDSITPLGDLDLTNSNHLILAQQFARDWLGGNSTMDTLHVHTHHYSALQCLLFFAQDTTALISAIVPLWRNFCRGHLIFPAWQKITIQMTHDTILKDQTQKMMAHMMTQWLATVKPELFVDRPLVQINRELWMKMLATTIRRDIKRGNSDVSKNKGLHAIYILVPLLSSLAETSHATVDTSLLIDKLTREYRTTKHTLRLGFEAIPGPVGALQMLTSILNHCLTKEQTEELLAFCGKNSDQSKFPNWVEMGIIAPRPQSAIEETLLTGPWKVSTFSKGLTDTIASEVTPDPVNQYKGFLKCPDSTEWCAVLLFRKGNYVFTPDYTGIARKANGEMSQFNPGNWRVSYGLRDFGAADVLDPTRQGFSSAGVRCDPTIKGPGKWVKPGTGDLVPGCDYPIHIHYGDYMRVIINGRVVLQVVLAYNEHPMFAIKGVFAKVEYEPADAKNAPVAAASNSSSSSVSWHEAVATHPASGVEKPVVEKPVVESKSEDPFVTKIVAEVQEKGIDSVIASLLHAQMPQGELTPFEKELAAALREIGTKGVSSAIQMADKIANC